MLGATLNLMDEVVVEGADGRLWTVRGGECSCGNRGCAHARLTAKFRARDRDMWFYSKSAIHKELRRQDVPRAVAFGRMLEEMKEGTVRQYLQRIIFEETRSLALVRLFTQRPPVRWESLVERFCAARKHWEFEWDVGCMSDWWLTTERMYPMEVKVDQFRELVRREEWREAYCLMMSVVYEGYDNDWTKDARAHEMMEILSEVGCRRFPDWAPEIKWMASHANQNDEPTTLFAVAAGIWKPEANEFHVIDYKSRMGCGIPWFREYVWDMHTLVGKDRIRKAGNLIGWGKPMPKGIDLRLSGSNSGCCWRKVAFPKFGTIEVPWENAVPPEPMRASFMAAFKAVG